MRCAEGVCHLSAPVCLDLAVWLPKSEACLFKVSTMTIKRNTLILGTNLWLPILQKGRASMSPGRARFTRRCMGVWGSMVPMVGR